MITFLPNAIRKPKWVKYLSSWATFRTFTGGTLPQEYGTADHLPDYSRSQPSQWCGCSRVVLPTKDLCSSFVNDSCVDTTASHPCSRHESAYMSEKGTYGIIGNLTQQDQLPRSIHLLLNVQVPLFQVAWLTRPLRLIPRGDLKIQESCRRKDRNISGCNWKAINLRPGKSDHDATIILVANLLSTRRRD
jgi:hypothetical protein